MHQGNIFSFSSDDQFERTQQNTQEESSNNMLSEMFNYAGHTDVLSGHESSSNNININPHHRIIQQIRPEFYGGVTANMINNWSSSIMHEDAATLAAKNTAAEILFMNPNQRAPTSPHEQNQSSLIFEQGIRQLGPSLSLSSSFRSQGSAAFCLYNSEQQQSQHENQEQYQTVQISSSVYGSASASNVLRNSKFARAAQEMLEEFCSVSRGHVRGKTVSHVGGGVASSSCSKDVVSLSPADRFENHRKKSKLISMLDEVERRYNHYCEQMQMVVNSFDSVMGFGAATPYTALARKAMSRHFRCLKDCIAAQLKRTCELLGDSDGGGGSGLTKGETPKLRLIDQTLRQQRAFHQMGMMEQEAWRPQRGLPDRSVTILRAWLFEHFLSPYPSDADKHLLARKTGLSRNQVSNWFINARVRLWKPMVEDMYQEEAKEAESQSVLLPTLQQPHSPDSNAPAETVSINPSRSQLDNFDHNASNSVLFPPPALEDEMYRRAAAARTGDLSLTLGLRHAGGNAPDNTGGRFGI